VGRGNCTSAADVWIQAFPDAVQNWSCPAAQLISLLNSEQRRPKSVCSLRQSRSREASDQGSYEGHADSPLGSDHAEWTQPLIEKAPTGAAIRQQDKATQDLIRTAFERCARVYKSADGLKLPVAFKVGSGGQPT